MITATPPRVTRGSGALPSHPPATRQNRRVTHGPAPRTLIWTPAGTAELQLALHRGRVGSAVLVPVESGTVALPTPGADLRHVAAVAREARRLSGRAVVFRWNDRAALALALSPDAVLPAGWHWGPRGAAVALTGGSPLLVALRPDRRAQPERRDRAVAGLAGPLGAPPERVAELVADWRTGGPEIAPALCAAAGLAGAAKVAGLVQAGQADRWLGQLPRPPRRVGRPLAALVGVLLAALLAVALVAGVALPWPLAALCGLLVGAGAAVVLRGGSRPGLAAGQPVNAVLPVVPVTQGVAPTENAPSD